MFPTEKGSVNKEKGSGCKVKGKRRVKKGSGSKFKGACELKYEDSKTVGKIIYPIFRTPENLRNIQREIFDPTRVRLGIYDHEMNRNSFEMMDIKVKALCTTAKRVKGMTVDCLVAEVQALDLKIRKCYRDSKDSYSKEILAWNFALDACFILEYLRLSIWFTDRNVEREIMSDIYKLENQIPLFILVRILELEFQNHEKAISKLADIMCMPPEIAILPFSLKPKELRILQAEIEANIKEGACHLLHLLSKTVEAFLRPSYISTGDTRSTVFDRDAHIVQSLLIKFKPSTDGQVRFKKGWFGSAVLYLPQIHLFEETKPLLGNLIAFAVGSESNIIGHYMFFLKCILSSNSKSIGALKEGQVIISDKSNEELEIMLNNISNETCESCGPFENVWIEVKEYCSSPYNKWVGNTMLWLICLLFFFSIIGFVIKW